MFSSDSDVERLWCIFDADDELAVVVLGNEVVEQCRTGTADVERACRARSKTNAYFL